MELLLDNLYPLLLVVMFSYHAYTSLFKIYRNSIEPEDLMFAYFLLKRKNR